MVVRPAAAARPPRLCLIALLLALLVRPAGGESATVARRRIRLLPDLYASPSLFSPVTAELVLNPAALARGVLNFGEPELFRPVHAKLVARSPPACLSVLVLGGSISQGHAYAPETHPDRPVALEDAWPVVLKNLLDDRFPCGHEGHEVRNEARSAAGSDMHLDMVVAWSSNASSPLRRADVVVVESAQNDLHDMAGTADTHLDAGERALKYTELLVQRLLQSRSPPPGVLYLAASTRGRWDSLGWGGRQDAAHTHARVTRHYGLPHVSAVDALGPFVTPEQQAWLESVYKVDAIGHPTKLGHGACAALVMHQLLALLASVASPILAAAPAPPFSLPPTLLAVDPAELEMYATGRPLRVAAVNLGERGIDSQPTRLVAPAEANGWEVRSDAPGKPPGLVATAVGSTVDVVITPDEAANIRWGKLHLLLLKSYERMGVLRVTLLAAPFPPGAAPRAAPGDPGDPQLLWRPVPAGQLAACKAALAAPAGGGEGGGAARVVAKFDVDCAWGHRVSELATEPLAFPPVGPDACLVVRLEVAPARPPRGENKVKLLSFVMW